MSRMKLIQAVDLLKIDPRGYATPKAKRKTLWPTEYLRHFLANRLYGKDITGRNLEEIDAQILLAARAAAGELGTPLHLARYALANGNEAMQKAAGLKRKSTIDKYLNDARTYFKLAEMAQSQHEAELAAGSLFGPGFTRDVEREVVRLSEEAIKERKEARINAA
ncbi:hypothetical protein PQR52_10225 [Paraburkholderia aspalathi]|uniref:hypothetical protein n=1 Tax=Paraburkholderia aspalathi TaxID=1324617 RepID=UPI0038B75C7B